MKTSIVVRGILFGFFIIVSYCALAFLPPTSPPLPDRDDRANRPAAGESLAAGRNAALSKLHTRVPDVDTDFDAVTHSPKWIASKVGFLTGPGGKGRAVPDAALAASSANDSNRVVKAFLHEYRDLFGCGPEALDQARINRDFVTPHSGMRTVVWQQEVGGVSVFDAVMIAHTTGAGELVNIGSQFVPLDNAAIQKSIKAAAALQAAPPISAEQAIAIAAADVEEAATVNQVAASGDLESGPEKNQKFHASFLKGDTAAKLIWLPMDGETLRLCWDILLTGNKHAEMYRILVDAETGAVHVRRCLTVYLSDASYRVFTSDSPSPFSPGNSTPSSTQPALISRTLVTIPALDTNASPNGWINDGGNETVGNNVDAHTDRNNDNSPDLPRPQGSPTRVFDFPMDLSAQDPTNYSSAAVTQLFYWNNFMHDKLYALGFTEAAGNFQSNNFGRGGLGNDAVQADAQDGGGFNNANFSTPSDGLPGRMQMYLFDGPSPHRDGDLDAEVVLHEYTHGLSNRRVGGGVGISALQPSGMGEGWSDFYGLSLLSEAGDNVNGVYAAGAYVTYQLSGLTTNYYFGIRRYPYCTDMTKNPLTFKDIDPVQASAHTGIPRSPIIGTTANEVHNMGEVWCVTLWDARANLITKYGWAVGNQLVLQLVTDGMNLSPANPTFLQARDAILQADRVDTGGANQRELWAAFGKRGMGASATSPASSTTTGLVEAYDIPDNMQVNPATLSASGPVGGPFTPNPAYFSITNLGTNTLTWRIANPAGWISISPTNGSLAAGAGQAVAVSVSALATNFSLGTSNAVIWFTNETSGAVQSRSFSLYIVGRGLFDSFDPGIHLSLWSAFGGTIGSTVIATNYGGYISAPNSLWFGDAGSRFATTIPIDTRSGGTISFYLHLANGSASPWENVDIPGEGVVLEYSTNSGVTWTTLGTYDTSTYYSWTAVTIPIPAGAQSPAAQFRWRQLSHSGTGFDHWALDNVSIDAGPASPSIVTQASDQNAKPGHNVSFVVSARGSSPLVYQWRKDGTNLVDGGRISGAASPQLSISNVVLEDSGNYSVQVTNSLGSVTSSNAALVVNALDHFVWAPIASPQVVNTAFPAAIEARSELEELVTNFNGAVALSAGGGLSTTNVLGTNTVEVAFPMFTGYDDERTQVIYPPSEIGAAGKISSLALDVAELPGPMNFWTIRLKHVPFASYTNYSWESTGWTVVYQTNVSLTSTGWVEFKFSTPFQYDGTNNLMIDFSFNNSNALNYVYCRSTSQSNLRTLYYYTASLYGDPLTWSNGYPSQYVTTYTPNIRLIHDSSALSINPASPVLFTNGVWSGAITVQQPATNVILRADYASGAVGLSAPFDAVLQDDVGLEMLASANPATVGVNLVYTLNVTNTGPGTASGVVITNMLPAGVAFVSAAASQGSYNQNGGTVIGNLGTITGGGGATLTVVVTPTVANVTLTNVATVTRAEADSYMGNNTATVLTTVTLPGIAIGDAQVVEKNVGTTNLVFNVNLAAPSAQTVTVNFATANGTAAAGSDYVSTNGTLTFPPGITNRSVSVAVLGDTLIESNETVYVNLSSPVNGVLTRSQGVGTIVNDDGFPGVVDHFTWGPVASPQITNVPFTVAVTARDAFGAVATNYSGAVHLSAGTGSNQVVQTVNILSFILYSDTTTTGEYVHTLTAISNYFPNFVETSTTTTDPSTLQAQLAGKQVFLIPEQENSGSGILGPLGSSWATVLSNFVNNGGIVIACSWATEEHLILSNSGLMNLSRIGNASADTVALGVSHVLNQGISGSFSGSYIGWYPSANGTVVMQSVANGYPVVLARDIGRGHVVMIGTDYFTIGTSMDRIVANAVKWAQTGTIVSSNFPVVPDTSGAFSNGAWSGTIAMPNPATNVMLLADDGDGHTGTSNPFHVTISNQPPIILSSPADAAAVIGGSAGFQVDAIGAAPLYYQWRLNGAIIPGATNSTLTLNAVSLGQAGSYSVVVWNPYGTNSSSKATLFVSQVIAWGAGTNNSAANYNYSQSVVPTGLTNVAGLSGGLFHSLAFKEDGGVAAWGAGLSNTAVSPQYGQSMVPALGSVVAVAGGGYHSLALRGDGTIAAWGAGTNVSTSPQYGQLIIPSMATNVVAIAAGDYHSVALRSDGRVLAWGYNGYAQTNVPAAATSNVVAIASRGNHILALKSDGSLVHWGYLTSLPTGVSNIVAIAAGVNHCLALKNDGTVVLWGNLVSVPTDLSNVVEIAAGYDHSLALKSDGSVVTWGATNYSRAPVPAVVSNVVGIACGGYNSLAILGGTIPVIKWQPKAQSVLLGDSAFLSALAVGPQLHYQWRKNGANIGGATNFSYRITGVQSSHSGDYCVVITNGFGAITSSVVPLNVLAPVGNAVDSPNLVWTTGGNVAWFGETAVTHDGIDAAQSGLISASQQSSVQTIVGGPGVLAFWWKVSSEEFFDRLRFFIDGTEQAAVSGEADWQLQNVAVGAGNHTLTWSYEKDSSVDVGLDAGWLDQVTYATNPPAITSQPLSQTNWMGTTLSLSVTASGAPPLSYQWIKAGTNMAGANASILYLTNATRHASGLYSIRVSNPGGSTVSSNAMIVIRVPQRLSASMQPDGTFLMFSSDADGGTLTADDLTNLEVQASLNLSDWATVTNALVLTNGNLMLLDLETSNHPSRFYRVVEH